MKYSLLAALLALSSQVQAQDEEGAEVMAEEETEEKDMDKKEPVEESEPFTGELWNTAFLEANNTALPGVSFGSVGELDFKIDLNLKS